MNEEEAQYIEQLQTALGQEQGRSNQMAQAA